MINVSSSIHLQRKRNFHPSIHEPKPYPFAKRKPSHPFIREWTHLSIHRLKGKEPLRPSASEERRIFSVQSRRDTFLSADSRMWLLLPAQVRSDFRLLPPFPLPSLNFPLSLPPILYPSTPFPFTIPSLLSHFHSLSHPSPFPPFPLPSSDSPPSLPVPRVPGSRSLHHHHPRPNYPNKTSFQP